MGNSVPGSSVHGISQQEYWSGFPFPPPGDLLNSVIKHASPVSPALAGEFFATEPPGKPTVILQPEKMKSVTASIFPSLFAIKWWGWLLIAKFRLKLKKVGKTTRPFRYDLNQIPYDYTLEVRNRFKGLDLIDRVLDKLWTEAHDIVQETGIKTIPMEKKCKKAKWLSDEVLQMAVKRREMKSKGEKERYPI